MTIKQKLAQSYKNKGYLVFRRQLGDLIEYLVYTLDLKLVTKF